MAKVTMDARERIGRAQLHVQPTQILDDEKRKQADPGPDTGHE
jgi:hypothetical protein